MISKTLFNNDGVTFRSGGTVAGNKADCDEAHDSKALLSQWTALVSVSGWALQVHWNPASSRVQEQIVDDEDQDMTH